MADGLLAIAIAIEERVELEAIFAGPCQVRDEPFTEFRREVRGRAA